jgi:hypothetical protein
LRDRNAENFLDATPADAPAMTVRPPQKVLTVLALISAPLLPAALDAGAQSASTATFRVTARSACYVSGPQQGRPPEAMIAAGAMVKHVPARAIGVYRRVETESGLKCWIDGAVLSLAAK